MHELALQQGLQRIPGLVGRVADGTQQYGTEAQNFRVTNYYENKDLIVNIIFNS